MWGRGVVAAGLALALLSGCSGDKDDGKAAAPVTTVTTATAGCPALATPAGTTDATTANGDFDGDGAPDRLITARAAAGGPWRVRMELAAGGGAEAELPATADGVKAIGGTRLDVGPADAAFAVIGRGGTGLAVGLFVLRQCKVERVTLAGKPAEFPIGSGANSRSGLTCQVPGLVAYAAASADGRAFQASSVSYLLVGVILDEAHRATTTLGADAPELAAYGSFACGSLRL